MAKYLKKKKLYELVKRLLLEAEIPMLKVCEYKKCRSQEWLAFPVGTDWYDIVTQNAGAWVCINTYHNGTLVCRDIYCEIKKDGTYGYHSKDNYEN